MIAFAAIFKNNFLRLLQEKARLLLMQVMLAGAVAIAILISTRPVSLGNIALVGTAGQAPVSSEYVTVTLLEAAPPMSALVSGKYDAVVTATAAGYEIQTIKSDSFRQILQAALQNPASIPAQALQTQGIATSVLGYMVMFVLMQGVFLMYMFAEDKEKKQITRIAASPVAFTAYLLAHSLFAFFVLLLPAFAILYIVSGIMGVSLGISVLQCGLLLALLCGLATSFAMFLNALFKVGDNANMAGSAIVVLTSILAGTFYSFEKNNQVLDTIITVLPQKAYLAAVQAAEAGALLQNAAPQVVYLIVLIAAFLSFSIIKTRHMYIKSN